jgi:hypothetical protein
MRYAIELSKLDIMLLPRIGLRLVSHMKRRPGEMPGLMIYVMD